MDNVEEEVDFAKDVEDWDYIQSVQFQEEAKEKIQKKSEVLD